MWVVRVMDKLPGNVTPVEARECPDCGLLQMVPSLEGGSVAHCGRCNGVLRRAARQSSDFPLACAALASTLFVAALIIPFMSIRAPGREASSTLFAGPEWLQERGLWPLAVLVMGVLIVMPGLKLLGLVTVLTASRQTTPPRWMGRVYRYTKLVSPWAMLEVFVLGSFIAYTRLGQLAKVAIEPGTWFLLGSMLATVTCQATMDEEAIWDLAEDGRSDDADGSHPHVMCHGCGRLERAPEGDECWRCHATLHVRTPHTVRRTWALTAGAILMYIPANLLPVMTVRRLGTGDPHTILSGVTELFAANLVPLGLLVFIASFVVPILKIVGILVMLISTAMGTDWRLRERTKAYRVIDAVGRWSMIDVFVLSTLVGLVHMGYLGSVLPGWGAAAFGAVVVLTMLAAEEFDPRVMWDAAASRAASSASSSFSTSFASPSAPSETS